MVLTSFFFRSFVSEDVMFSRQLMIQTKTPGGGGVAQLLRLSIVASSLAVFVS